jgi:hypothetical protein
MEKKILQYSYWLGLLCAVVAVAWRAATVLGYFTAPITQKGFSLTYNSFLNGAVLFLLTAIATGAYQAGNKQ